MGILKQIKNLIKSDSGQEILLEKIEKINEERKKTIEEKSRLEKEMIRIEEEKRRAENARILAEKTKEEGIIFSQLKLIGLRLQDLESERRKTEKELVETQRAMSVEKELKQKPKSETAEKKPEEEAGSEPEKKLSGGTEPQKSEETTGAPEKETDSPESERNFWEKLEKIKTAEKRKEAEIDEKAAARLTGAKKIAAFLGKTLKGGDEEAEKAAKEKEMILTSSQLAVDLYKDSSEIVVFAHLPGVEIKDLDISIEGQNDIIKIKAQSRRPELEKTEKEGRFALSECKWPSYYRELNLNEEINVFGIEAKLQNGALILYLPILKPGQTRIIKRKIEVKQ